MAWKRIGDLLWRKAAPDDFEAHPMPMPLEHTTQDFDRFLRDLIDQSGLATRNQVYTVAQAVFQAFRRRLEVRDAVRFAGVLPPVLRAIFVADWDTDEPRRPFDTRELLTEEVKALRRDHNFSSDRSIEDVAIALRKNMNAADLDRVLATLPKEAAGFWSVAE